MRRDLRPSAAPAAAAARARDAIVLGAALLCSVRPHDARTTHAAARMELMACCRRARLLDAPLSPSLHERFALVVAEFAAEPARVRRAMAATMDRLAGSVWAPDVLAAIARIGAAAGPLDPVGRLWLDRIRAALALPPPLPAPPAGGKAQAAPLRAAPARKPAPRSSKGAASQGENRSYT